MYDNYEKIAQNKDSTFINFIWEEKYIFDLAESILISDLNCNQEYYIVISNTYPYQKISVSGFIVNIMDADIGNITLSPELSDFFHFIKEKIKKKLYYILLMKQNMAYLVLVLMQRFKYLKIMNIFIVKKMSLKKYYY